MQVAKIVKLEMQRFIVKHKNYGKTNDPCGSFKMEFNAPSLENARRAKDLIAKLRGYKSSSLVLSYKEEARSELVPFTGSEKSATQISQTERPTFIELLAHSPVEVIAGSLSGYGQLTGKVFRSVTDTIAYALYIDDKFYSTQAIKQELTLEVELNSGSTVYCTKKELRVLDSRSEYFIEFTSNILSVPATDCPHCDGILRITKDEVECGCGKVVEAVRRHFTEQRDEIEIQDPANIKPNMHSTTYVDPRSLKRKEVEPNEN